VVRGGFFERQILYAFSPLQTTRCTDKRYGFVGGEVWRFFMLEGELKETLVGELNAISPKFWGVMGGAGR